MEYLYLLRTRSVYSIVACVHIYRNNNTGEGNLYETHINDEGKWSTPEKMPEGINTKYTESHATISADGTRLFFTSNRPGMGKTDIYFSQKISPNENTLPIIPF